MEERMAKKLLIVESPAKAGTIKKYLGKDYDVTASMGHIIDLPKSQLGVDVENNFEPKYITIGGKGELLTRLKKTAKAADKVSKASKFFGAVGQVLKDINPLEQVGSLIGFYAGKNALENLVAEKSAAIALQVTSSLEEPYQNDVIEPLLSQLEEERKTLLKIQQQGDAEFEAYKSKQKEMDADLKLLSSMTA